MTKEEMWSAGKALLESSGMAKSQCGAYIGKLVKDYGDELVSNAIQSAIANRPADPRGYLKAVCIGKQRKSGVKTVAGVEQFAGKPVVTDGAGRPIEATPIDYEAEGIL